MILWRPVAHILLPDTRVYSLIIRDIGRDGSEAEVSVGAGIVVVTIAEAVAAMPEQPSPPAIDFRRAFSASVFVAIHHAVLVLDIFVSPAAVSPLRG